MGCHLGANALLVHNAISDGCDARPIGQAAWRNTEFPWCTTPVSLLAPIGSLDRRESRIRAEEMPSVCNACVVTVGCPGLFMDVWQGSETVGNGTGAAVYAAQMNSRGFEPTCGRRVRILSPRPPFLKFRLLESIVCKRGRPKSRLRV